MLLAPRRGCCDNQTRSLPPIEVGFMAAVICPACSRALKVADALGGKKVRCPVCGEVLTAPCAAEPVTLPPAPSEPAPPSEMPTLPPAGEDPHATLTPAGAVAPIGPRDDRAPP